MNRSVPLAAAAALLVVLAGCGSEVPPGEAVPELRQELSLVDDAVVAGDYGQAREALDALARATVGARESGQLTAEQADPVLAAIARLTADLPGATPPVAEPAPTTREAPPRTSAAPDVTRDPAPRPSEEAPPPDDDGPTEDGGDGGTDSGTDDSGEGDDGGGDDGGDDGSATDGGGDGERGRGDGDTGPGRGVGQDENG